MEIVFGWHLDGVTFPETVSGATATFNSAVCGPSRLLNLLETSLGLGGRNWSTALRVAQYLTALESIDTGELFFSASFSVDPWSTAKLILSMRDELIAGGWNGQPLSDINKSLALTQLEDSVLACSVPDRLRQVIDCLQTANVNPFRKLTLMESPDSLPYAWKTLFQLLQKTGAEISLLSAAPQSNSPDLALLQSAFMRSADHGCLFENDGSFAILDADDEVQAAEVLAAWLASKNDDDSLVLINNDRFSILDEACRRHGIPRIGKPANSPYRGLLQILPLAFELAWTPFNPARCLEFLSISGGPIPRSVSWPLKDAIKRQPGIDGPLWIEAWQKVRQIQETKLNTNAQSTADLDDQITRWKSWFTPLSKRDSALTSANIEVICRRVEDWAMKTAARHDDYSLYHVASQHASELAAIVNGFGTRSLTLHQLRYVMDTVISEGSSEVSNGAEASPWTVVDQPGQVWGAADAIIWWNFAASQPTQRYRDLWSEAESQVLRSAGIHIEPASQKCSRQAQSWKAPLLNARKHLILCVPRTSLGQPSINHPLWDEVVGCFPGNSLEAVTNSASRFFQEPSISVAGHEIESSQRATTSLPKPLRTWSIKANLITPRKKESYTSLERLLGCPLAWTLEYQARMRSGALQTIAEEERLTGDFAHAAISCMFAESTDWQPSSARARILELMDDLLPKVASSMLLPGNSVRLRKTKDTIADSTAHLIQILNHAELKVQACEFPIDTAFGDTAFGGSIDILVRTKDDKPVVLDLKWSRYPGVYRQKLLEGNALQLAAYGWCMKPPDPDADFAPVAFYLLRQALLFADNQKIFPSYAVNSHTPIESTWERACADYRTTLDKLIAGLVIATGIVDGPHQENPKPLIEPPCNVCSFSHFCGVETLE